MSEPCGYFVAGTDTGVGKTSVTLGLMQLLQRQGRSVAAMKPVAAGCEMTPAGLRNEDAERLLGQASVELAYEQVNPWPLAAAIAPHLAAGVAGVSLDIDKIIKKYNEIESVAECVLVEGVGGWQVPLNRSETLADLARGLGLEVILVVGIRLGCLNHALLTAESIRSAGCMLSGWVANRLPGTMEHAEANILALQERLACPLLGTIPTLPVVTARTVADYLVLPLATNT